MANVIRVIRRNFDYDKKHRPGFLALKIVLGFKVMYAGFNRIGYDEWLDAHRKANSMEARLDRSKRFESTTTHLEMLERELDAIKVKQIHHARAHEDDKAVPVCNVT